MLSSSSSKKKIVRTPQDQDDIVFGEEKKYSRNVGVREVEDGGENNQAISREQDIDEYLLREYSNRQVSDNNEVVNSRSAVQKPMFSTYKDGVKLVDVDEYISKSAAQDFELYIYKDGKPIGIKDLSLHYSVSDFLEENHVGILAKHQYISLTKQSLAAASADFHIEYIEDLSVVEAKPELVEEYDRKKQLVINKALGGTPSFLAVSNYRHWSVIALLPTGKNGEIDVVYMNSAYGKGATEYFGCKPVGFDLCQSVVNEINTRPLEGGGARTEVLAQHIYLEPTQQIESNCGAVAGLNIAGIAAWHRARGQISLEEFLGSLRYNAILSSPNKKKDFEELVKGLFKAIKHDSVSVEPSEFDVQSNVVKAIMTGEYYGSIQLRILQDMQATEQRLVEEQQALIGEYNIGLQKEMFRFYESLQSTKAQKSITRGLEEKTFMPEDRLSDGVDSHESLSYKPSSYPNDLVHGLLAAHCADETGKEAGNSKIKKGYTVQFRVNNHLRIKFAELGLELHQYLRDWLVHDVIEDKKTGYLGIVYINKAEHQLVLAQRSTNFALSLTTKNFLGQSGAQTDVESALMGRIVGHQAHAYKATRMAVDYAKELGFILSITGHSLGSWLAELSVFYCNTDMNYKNVKGITFDGPGSYEMMKQMSASDIRGTGASFKPEELDIVSYLSAPNVVNSANKHVGMVYRVFPEIEHAAPHWLAKATGEKNLDAFLVNAGHDLPYILPYFDIKTGIPSKATLVTKWPSITHKDYGDSSETLLSKHVNDLVKGKSFIAKIGAKLGIKIVDTALSKLVGKEASTLGSLVYFIRDLANGQVNLDQFWEVHKYLNKNEGFAASPQDELGEFWRLYKGHYRVEEADLYSRKKSGELDRWLKKLKQSEAKLGQLSGELYERVKSCLELYEYRDASKMIQSVGVTIAELRDTIRILLHQSKEELEAFIGVPATTYKITPYFPNKIITQSRFVGRTEELEAIQEKLESSKIIMIRGMPGLGKTSLVRHCVQVTEDYIPIWLSADSKESLARSYREFGEKGLGLKLDKLEEEMVMRTVNSKLSSSGQEILLIFDNLEDDYVEFYLENLPRKVKAIITTRHPNLLSHRDIGIKLEPFDKPTSLDYLIQNGIRQKEANLIVGKVGNLPYRLHLALGYKRNNRGKPINELLADLPSVEGELDVFAKKLMKKKPDEWKILQHISWFDPDFIPEEILLRLLDGQREFTWKVIENLESLSLVEVVERDDSRGLSIHRETQEQIARYTKESPQQLLLEIAALLNEFLPVVTDNPDEKWQAAKDYTSTVEYMFRYVDERGIVLSDNEELASLNAKLSHIYNAIFVNPKKGLYYRKRSLKMEQAIYKGNHKTVALSLNYIGILYNALGDSRKGLDYMERSLNMIQAIHEGDHPDIADSLNDVGAGYFALGDIRKGLDYYERSLKMNQAMYKGDHSAVADSLNNVGGGYHALGDVMKGLDYYERSLKMKQAIYEGDHPTIAASLSNIGFVYEDLGNARKGLTYQEQALKMRQALYKGDHPDIAKSLNDVGTAYKVLGDIRKGLDYYECSLKMYQAVYEGAHPYVAASLNEVGNAYEVLGDVKQGIDYYERSLKMRMELYEGDHPDVAAYLNKVGSAYKVLGDVKQGIDYYERGLKMYQVLYEGDDEDVATSLHDLGLAYRDLGDIRKGIDYMERSLKMKQALYEGDHLVVAASLNNIGLAYRDLGDIRNGIDYIERSLKMYKALYEGAHVSVATSLYILGLAYRDLGDIRNALDYAKRGLKMMQELYEGDHTTVADFLNAVGIAYHDLGDDRKGLNYLERSLAMRQALYEGNHPDVASSLNNVGASYQALGDAQKGLKYMEEALEMYKALYPYGHTRIAALLNNVGIVYLDLGDIKKGSDYKEQALKMSQALYKAGHHVTVSFVVGNAMNQEEKEGFKGQGTLGYAADSYLEYYNSGIDRMLELRLNALGFGDDVGVMLLKSRYCAGEFGEVVRKLAHDIDVAISGEAAQTVLVPLNLYGKHWVGLLFRNAGALIEVAYMDSEQGVMLPWLKDEIKDGLAIYGYESRFSETRLEKQRANNCGFELVENFVYYLTGNRATQEGAVYLHSLLVENSLLDPRGYGLKLEENDRLIGVLANLDRLEILEVPLLAEGRLVPVVVSEVRREAGQGFLDRFGFSLFCKKLLYRQELSRFANMVREYDIVIPDGLTSVDLLLDNSKFNKLVMNRMHPDKNKFGAEVAHQDTLFVRELRGKLAEELDVKNLLEDGFKKINSVLHKASVGAKALDVIVDSARLAYEPTLTNGKKVALDVAYLYGMACGVNGYSVLISGVEAGYQLYRGEYHQAFNVAAGTLNAMALPFILVRADRPYLAFAYGAWVAVNTVYGAMANAYSFVLEFANEEASLRSALAYRYAAKTLSESPLQQLYDFGKVARGYEIQANNLLCEKAKLDKQAQLEAEHGEFGRKLFDYIYRPMMEEQCDLANKILEGVVTQEEAEGLKSKHIKVMLEPQSYEHCVENVGTRGVEHEEYYCFNTQVQVLDRVIISNSGGLEVMEQL